MPAQPLRNLRLDRKTQIQLDPSRSPQASIRVKVNLVSMPAVVHNGKGMLILDLDKKDFRIFDDGVEQKVEDFEMGGAPISMAIVVETSSRIQALLPAIQRTGILFTQTVLGEGGDATVIGYNDEVDKLLDFTSDDDAIEATIKNLQYGTTGAKLYDALAEAVTALRNRPADRRRVIVTLAEAVDTGSESKLGQVLRDAQQANIIVYSIGLSSTAAQARGPEKQGGAPAARRPGPSACLRRLARLRRPIRTRRAPATPICWRWPAWAVQHATAPIRDHPLELATIATGGLYQLTVRDQSIEAGDRRHRRRTPPAVHAHLSAGRSWHGRLSRNQGGGEPRGLKVRSRPGYYVAAPEN